NLHCRKPNPSLQITDAPPTAGANTGTNTGGGWTSVKIAGVLVGAFVGIFLLLVVARFVYECGRTHASAAVAGNEESQVSSGHGVDSDEMYEDAVSGHRPHQQQQQQNFSRPAAPRPVPPLPRSDEPMYENIQPGQQYQNSRF
ncbi:unnamed protein product, partial [Meganyctiphanes norvegica]